jgi:hypothetical protein
LNWVVSYSSKYYEERQKEETINEWKGKSHRWGYGLFT